MTEKTEIVRMSIQVFFYLILDLAWFFSFTYHQKLRKIYFNSMEEFWHPLCFIYFRIWKRSYGSFFLMWKNLRHPLYFQIWLAEVDVSSQVRSYQVKSGQARFSEVGSYLIKSCQVMLCQFRSVSSNNFWASCVLVRK